MSRCNGFYSHNATRPKIHPAVEQSLSAPISAFHVASNCYTLNMQLAFFSGQSSCSVQSNHYHMDTRFNSCKRREGGFSPTHERVFHWEFNSIGGSLCHICAFLQKLFVFWLQRVQFWASVWLELTKTSRSIFLEATIGFSLLFFCLSHQGHLCF